MIISPVEIKQKLGVNKYALTIAVAKRARELNSGKQTVVQTDSKKPVTMAIDEFVSQELEIVNDEA